MEWMPPPDGIQRAGVMFAGTHLVERASMKEVSIVGLDSDRRPKTTAGRSELYAYHPEHTRDHILTCSRRRSEEI